MFQICDDLGDLSDSLYGGDTSGYGIADAFRKEIIEALYMVI